MAKGKPGVDSSVIVTTQVGGTGLIDLAKALYGDTPVFWGRYFTSTSTGGTVEYRHLKENQALRDNNTALKLDPNNTVALENRAQLYEALGRRDDAAADRQRLKQLKGK